MIKTIWKIYFWFLLLVIVAIFGYDTYDVINGSDINYYNIPIHTIQILALLGVFGYIYQRCYFHVNLWKTIFYIQIIILLYSCYIVLTEFSLSNLNQSGIAFLLFFTIALMAPEILALYLYSYKSNKLWLK
jgi:hypothetical protein